MFFKIGVLNNFAIFTEIHLCWSLFFKKLQAKLFEKKIQHRCFSCKYREICKSSFFNKARLVVASKEPMIFSIYLKNEYLPNMLLLRFLKLCYFFVLAIEIRYCDALLLSFRNYRYASHKHFTWWIHSRLGKGVRKVIPSSVMWSIRKNYPSENSAERDFKQAEND